MKRFVFAGLLAAFVMLMTFCKHAADLSVAPSFPAITGNLCFPDTIYFQNSAFPVVYANCARSGCHDAATHKHGLELTDYSHIMELVNPFDPAGSKLYKVLFSNQEGRMPPNQPLTDDQKSIIYYWIKQGAFNNACLGFGCDTTNVTYTTTLEPILQGLCTGCHSGSNPSGGISLTTYDQTVAVANGGRLIGALRHDNGYYAMPPNGFVLSSCQVREFELWITLGNPQ